MKIGRLSERGFFGLIKFTTTELIRGSFFYGALTALAIFALLSGIIVEQILRVPKIQVVTITDATSVKNSRELSLLVADTFYARFKGLSERTDLPEADGMVFIFGKARHADFVMRNMKLHLDFAFIDETGTIIKVSRSIPHYFDGTISSEKPVIAVIEIPTLKPAARHLKVGKTISELIPLSPMH